MYDVGQLLRGVDAFRKSFRISHSTVRVWPGCPGDRAHLRSIFVSIVAGNGRRKSSTDWSSGITKFSWRKHRWLLTHLTCCRSLMRCHTRLASMRPIPNSTILSHVSKDVFSFKIEKCSTVGLEGPGEIGEGRDFLCPDGRTGGLGS